MHLSTTIQREEIVLLTGYNNEVYLHEKYRAKKRLIYRMYKDKSSLYGIEVVSTLFDSMEIAKTGGLTENYDDCKQLFDIIVKNVVIPVLLRGIAEEFLQSIKDKKAELV